MDVGGEARLLNQHGNRSFASECDAIAAVEFALVFPVFVVTVLASLDLGLVFFAFGEAATAADQIARGISIGSAALSDANSIAASLIGYSGATATAVCQVSDGLNWVVVDTNVPIDSVTVTGFADTFFRSGLEERSVMLLPAGLDPWPC